MTQGAGTNSYAYDPLNRLTQAAHPQPGNPTESFTYDPVGNRTSSHLATGQVHDAGNRLLEDSNFTYTYDENGNLTRKTSKANGELTTYTYDAESQLIRVDRPGLVAEYRYDALGRRIEKIVNGVSTRYIYDNEDIVAEVDGTGTLRAFYLHGPGIDEPLAMSRSGVGSLAYHADGLGSITTLTDLNGVPVRSYTYDSFGRIVTQTGTVTNPYTYTGRELDPESGLYYYRARYYDPTAGRFLQEDLLSYSILILFLRNLRHTNVVKQSISNFALQHPIAGNLYTYAGHNPINSTDPLGLQPLLPVPLGPGTYGGGLGQTIGGTTGWFIGATIGASCTAPGFLDTMMT